MQIKTPHCPGIQGDATLTPPLLIPKLVLFMLLPTLDHQPPHLDSMNFISPPS